MSTPAPPLFLFVTAIALLAWMSLVRMTTHPIKIPPADIANSLPALPRAGAWLSSVLVVFACSYPGNRILDWLIWLPSIAAACFGPRFFASRSVQWMHIRPPVDRPRVFESAASDRLLQQVTRYRSADGGETVHAQLHAEFNAGQRAASLYVAFCPPFERLPDVDVDSDDARIATAKLTQVLHQGAQVDVVLSRPAPTNALIPIELFAVEPARQ
jgi:hypothetical protein